MDPTLICPPKVGPGTHEREFGGLKLQYMCLLSSHLAVAQVLGFTQASLRSGLIFSINIDSNIFLRIFSSSAVVQGCGELSDNA